MKNTTTSTNVNGEYLHCISFFHNNEKNNREMWVMILVIWWGIIFKAANRWSPKIGTGLDSVSNE